MEPLHRALGLTDEEYSRIEEILGRPPNRAELAMYSVMWSEHCSYKSSRIHLKGLPSEGPHVVLGPGHGAGVVDVDGVGVAFRLESHNHPSYVEPFQGAATGVGGIVRDVLSMGARPIALLDPLRFGPLPAEGRAEAAVAERNRFLVEGVVSGISSYGNCIGVPTVGGEVKFEDCYSFNPLVNVMCIGVAPIGRLKLARAEGPGNKVLLLGSSTGRDGIGGASVLASASFDELAESKRPSVQVADPFTEKLLIEACLELIESGLVVGIQDLGAAGICCAASESAANAGNGMTIDLGALPRREPNMEPFELLTSESQERMLVVVAPADAEAALSVCRRFGLDASVIGEVTEGSRLQVYEAGELVADVPAASLGDGPVYDRPRRRPGGLDEALAEDLHAEAPPDPAAALLALVGSPNVASKRWVWEQYDHEVMLQTLVRPGHDAAVLRLPGTGSRLAVACDGNSRFCALDPFTGAGHAVAEAARNLSVLGATPLAVTNCMNFGSPEQPEVMWAFTEALAGMAEACRALSTPVTGGNVSFYNQTAGSWIDPTPVIGMIGAIPPGVKPPPLGFASPGDAILLIGSTQDELEAGEYARTVLRRPPGRPPRLDLAREAAAGAAVRRMIAEGLALSAHDCSEGGIGVALSECCVAGGIGAEVTPEHSLEAWRWLFSESGARILVSTAPEAAERTMKIASEEGIPCSVLGKAGGSALVVGGPGGLSVEVGALAHAFEYSFPGAMGYGPAKR